MATSSVSRWQIKGADRDSGEETMAIVEACDREGALAAASARGILTASVTRIGGVGTAAGGVSPTRSVMLVPPAKAAELEYVSSRPTGRSRVVDAAGGNQAGLVRVVTALMGAYWPVRWTALVSAGVGCVLAGSALLIAIRVLLDLADSPPVTPLGLQTMQVAQGATILVAALLATPGLLLCLAATGCWVRCDLAESGRQQSPWRH